MKYILAILIFSFVALSGLFLFLNETRPVEIFSSSATSSIAVVDANVDAPNQKPLADPPSSIKAVYFTAWTAGKDDKINSLIENMKGTEFNAMVIDIKDYSGYVMYDAKLPLVEQYKSKQVRIAKINNLVKKLHDNGIYAIARMAIFQDPMLSKARPDLAIHSKKTGGLWYDNRKLSWIDPSAQDAWDYNLMIAQDAANRGFDEINFDYIRFPSDGDLNDMVFPFYNVSIKESKSAAIKIFFAYLRNGLLGVKISADVFGLTTVALDDLGIGQTIQNAYEYFDYVSPMVYPSHYAPGFLGYQNPAKHPYEVVKHSMDGALERLKSYEMEMKNNTTSTASTTENILRSTFSIQHSKLRPWLQDFNLGAEYTAAMINKEIQAVYDSASSTPELLNGWMLWNPASVYSKETLMQL